MGFSHNLAKVKAELGLSNQRIGQAAGVSESAVRTWLSGSKSPSIDSVIQMSSNLNVPIMRFLTESKKEPIADDGFFKNLEIELSSNEKKLKLAHWILSLGDRDLDRVETVLDAILRTKDE